MNGGEALVAVLLEHGVDTSFCVPGESYLTILEALRQSRDRIRLVLNRHESGSTLAAEAYAKATGKPGIALVTRGPGATNASIGLHTAKQDSTPLVLFIGHVPSAEMGREAFQEIDYPSAFGPLTKRVIEVMRPEDVAQATADALHQSTAGRPGPVAVVLPEDVTEGEAGAVDIPQPRQRATLLPNADDIANAVRLIDAAEHPVIIGGGQINFENAHDALAQFAEASGAGVVSAFRRQDILPHEHHANLGHFGLHLVPYQKKFWADCDLVILAGARPDGATLQGYSLLRPDQRIIHIYPEDAAFAQTNPDMALKADAGPSLAALRTGLESPPASSRLAWRAVHHQEHITHATPGRDAAAQSLGAVDMAEIIMQLRARLPDEASIVNDSGAFAGWLHRHFAFRAPHSQFAACLGAMGYGMPGAIGAQLARPDRPVVALMGDGGFLMTGQEIVTGVQQKLPFIVLLFDNGMYGSIATHQYRRGGREAMYGTVMNSPDFAALARAYGAAAWCVERTEDFSNALEGALAEDGRPSLLHIKTDMRNLNANGPQMDG
ncbi:MAG: thiamine pyrophosphate-binding protein [Rhodospirillaceae bacterium]|jgi:acetolactate synthase I/II/III large subunit|nr:thiamine pyrophosphate-binding protein [Rhodospirillaceae bacterium]